MHEIAIIPRVCTVDGILREDSVAYPVRTVCKAMQRVISPLGGNVLHIGCATRLRREKV